jgi:hypothetical protein
MRETAGQLQRFLGFIKGLLIFLGTNAPGGGISHEKSCLADIAAPLIGGGKSVNINSICNNQHEGLCRACSSGNGYGLM